MLGHIRRGAGVFAAEREALHDAKQDEKDGSRRAERHVPGKYANGRRRRAHR